MRLNFGERRLHPWYERRRRALGAQGEAEVRSRPRLLTKIKIDDRLALLIERFLLRVRGDPDDFNGSAPTRARRDSKSPPERPRASKKLASQFLVDDGNLGRCGYITTVEVTTGEDPCSDGSEVTIAHLVERHAHVIVGQGRISIDVDLYHGIATERRAPNRARDRDARKRAQAFEDVSVCLDPLFGLNSSEASADPGQKHSIAPESRVERHEPAPTADEQAGARDHNQRQGNLSDDQRLPDAETRTAFGYSTSTRFHHCVRINAHRAMRGRQPEQYSGKDADRERERKHIHVRREVERDSFRHKADESTAPPGSKQHTQGGAYE